MEFIVQPSSSSGEVLALCISKKRGTSKTPVNEATFVQGFGIEGDAHAGKGDRQVSLLAYEVLALARQKGITAKPGMFAENITTRGVDLSKVAIRDRIKIGQVELEVTQVGKICPSPCAIYKKLGECIMPLYGVFARVVKGGKVKVGQKITVYPRSAVRYQSRLAVLVTSDSCSKGLAKDISGQLLVDLARDAGFRVVQYKILPDEEEAIYTLLLQWCEHPGIDAIITTGGTGLGPRDVTPEATARVVEKQIPGLVEVLRVKFFEQVPTSVLSRGIAGFRNKTLIVNLPGSPGAISDCFPIVAKILDHARDMLHGLGHRETSKRRMKIKSTESEKSES